MSRKYSKKRLQQLVNEVPGELEITEKKNGHIQVFNPETQRIVNWWPDSKKKTAHVDDQGETVNKGLRMVTADQVVALALEEPNA